MNQSVGGGYCDCGDREAWKDSFCCSIHERNAAGGGTNSLLKFPPEIVQRARAVFSAGGSGRGQHRSLEVTADHQRSLGGTDRAPVGHRKGTACGHCGAS